MRKAVYFCLGKKIENSVVCMKPHAYTDTHLQGDATLNLTTLECAVLGLTHAGELRAIRKKLFTTALPKPSYKSQPRGKFFYSEEANRWCLPNMASDRSVVSRSQRLNYDLWGLRPVQFSIYFGMQSLWMALGAMLLGLVIYVMTLSAFTRRLLLRVKRELFFSRVVTSAFL